MLEEEKRKDDIQNEDSANGICKEHEGQLLLRLTPLVMVYFGSVVALVVVAIGVKLVPLPPWVIALLLVAAAVLLAIVGAVIFHRYTVGLKAQYAAGAMPRPGTADPPTYAAWYAAQNWLVRAVAAHPRGC